MSRFDYFEPTANPDDRKTLRDFYAEYLDECDTDDMIKIAREIRQATGALEDFCLEDLFDNELDTYFESWTPSEILRNLDSDFNYNDRYFRVDSLGRIESCNNLYFDKYDIDEYLDAMEACPYRELPSEVQDVSDAFDEYEEACDELEEQEDDDEE